MANRTIPLAAPVADDVLAAQARAGDDRAVAALFERHAPGLFRLAYRLTGSVADGEDVVQDVFLGLRSALQRYEARDTLGGWLRRLTARRALMHRRAASRAAAREAVAARERPRQTLPNATDAIALHDAIARLPDTLRHVFVLTDVEGFSHAEVAGLLGISEAASRTRRHRAVGILQSHLRTP